MVEILERHATSTSVEIEGPDCLLGVGNGAAASIGATGPCEYQFVLGWGLAHQLAGCKSHPIGQFLDWFLPQFQQGAPECLPWLMYISMGIGNLKIVPIQIRWPTRLAISGAGGSGA